MIANNNNNKMIKQEEEENNREVKFDRDRFASDETISILVA